MLPIRFDCSDPAPSLRLRLLKADQELAEETVRGLCWFLKRKMPNSADHSRLSQMCQELDLVSTYEKVFSLIDKHYLWIHLLRPGDEGDIHYPHTPNSTAKIDLFISQRWGQLSVINTFAGSFFHHLEIYDSTIWAMRRHAKAINTYGSNYLAAIKQHSSLTLGNKNGSYILFKYGPNEIKQNYIATLQAQRDTLQQNAPQRKALQLTPPLNPAKSSKICLLF